MCSSFGISLLFQSVLASCSPKNESLPTNFDGPVIIIGSSALGFTAGYLLNQ
jgi:hypothetical protein